MRPAAVLIAPDTFKGCLSARRVAEALARGIRRVWPEVAVELRPLADGGEGTIEALLVAGGERRRSEVQGPLGQRVSAAWWLDGARAGIEMAQASGLALGGDVMAACSAGTGALIAEARRAGATEILVGAGGSATVDGGVGALRALGFRFLGAGGQPLPPGGGALVELSSIEAPDLGLGEARVTVLCDVQNPMLGAEGAARVYGPQKGASPEQVRRLEAGLARLAECLKQRFGRDPGALPGAGAAGGLAGGLWAALGAELSGGFDTIAELTGLDAALARADLVLTGEGRLDAQTAYGKTVAGLIARATAPVWAFAGEVTEAAEAWCPAEAVLLPIAAGPSSVEQSLAQASSLLEREAARIARLWSLK